MPGNGSPIRRTRDDHSFRAANAARHDRLFESSSVLTPIARPECRHVYNQYTLRVPKRDDVMAHLKANDIGCAIYYPVPLHLQQCYAGLGHSEGDLPEAERAAGEVISIPVYPELTDDMAAGVADKVREIPG